MKYAARVKIELTYVAMCEGDSMEDAASNAAYKTAERFNLPTSEDDDDDMLEEFVLDVYTPIPVQ